MTKRLGRAREETRRSQQAVEAERAGLAVILARLSTGVVSLAPDLTVRTANQAASAILGVDLEAAVGARFDESISDGALFTQFLAAVKSRLDDRSARLARADRAAVGVRQARAHVRLHGVAERHGRAPRGWCWCSTTSPLCCRRSAMRPGARWRGAWRTRSRIR